MRGERLGFNLLSFCFVERRELEDSDKAALVAAGK